MEVLWLGLERPKHDLAPVKLVYVDDIRGRRISERRGRILNARKRTNRIRRGLPLGHQSWLTQIDDDETTRVIARICRLREFDLAQHYARARQQRDGNNNLNNYNRLPQSAFRGAPLASDSLER